MIVYNSRIISAFKKKEAIFGFNASILKENTLGFFGNIFRKVHIKNKITIKNVTEWILSQVPFNLLNNRTFLLKWCFTSNKNQCPKLVVINLSNLFTNVASDTIIVKFLKEIDLYTKI